MEALCQSFVPERSAPFDGWACAFGGSARELSPDGTQYILVI